MPALGEPHHRPPASISAGFIEDEMSLICRVTNLSRFACDFSCCKSELRVPGKPLSPRKPGWLVSLLIPMLAPRCSGNRGHFWFVVIVAVCVLGCTKAAPQPAWFPPVCTGETLGGGKGGGPWRNPNHYCPAQSIQSFWPIS